MADVLIFGIKIRHYYLIDIDKIISTRGNNDQSSSALTMLILAISF
jgi:hypothetical protein